MSCILLLPTLGSCWWSESISPPARECSLPPPRASSGAPIPTLEKGLSISHQHPSLFVDGRGPCHACSFLHCFAFKPFQVKMAIFWEDEEVSEAELCSALKKREARVPSTPWEKGFVRT